MAHPVGEFNILMPAAIGCGRKVAVFRRPGEVVLVVPARPPSRRASVGGRDAFDSCLELSGADRTQIDGTQNEPEADQRIVHGTFPVQGWVRLND